jgi:hypothetical protein
MPTLIPQPTLPLPPPLEKEDEREEDRQNEEKQGSKEARKQGSKEEGVQRMTDNITCKACTPRRSEATEEQTSQELRNFISGCVGRSGSVNY